jgi:hypothetical protein
MESNNLTLWNSVEETDPNHTKQVTFGNKFTSINATYQIKNATEKFGTYGDKWGIKSIDYEFIDVVDNQVMVLAKAIFKYPLNGVDVTFPISSTIFMQEYSKKWKCVQADDEWAKKIETDITTKALSKLGFNADVFMGMYDDNKYINNLKEKYKDTPPPKPLPPIDDEKFGKYCDWIKDAITDKKGNLIDIDYLKARHTLNDEQEQELANVNTTT